MHLSFVHYAGPRGGEGRPRPKSTQQLHWACFYRFRPDSSDIQSTSFIHSVHGGRLRRARQSDKCSYGFARLPDFPGSVQFCTFLGSSTSGTVAAEYFRHRRRSRRHSWWSTWIEFFSAKRQIIKNDS